MSDSKEAQHVVLVCDESEAKGYADRDERFPGEVGVFAGILIPGERLAATQAEFDAVAARYRAGPGKLHITDLPPEQQASLRAELFALIEAKRLPCFFEAIHVAGFHAFFRRQVKLDKQGRRSRRSAIKLSLREPAPDSLHVALFFGLYSKLIAFCLEREKQCLRIEIRTDQVDAPIMKDFKATAAMLLDYGPKIERVTGFDPERQEVITGTVVRREIPERLRLPMTIAELEFKRIAGFDGLVLAADVLANSLAYVYHQRRDDERFRRLNRPTAVETHTLWKSLDSFNDWGAFDASDEMYHHPCDPVSVDAEPWHIRWRLRPACWFCNKWRDVQIILKKGRRHSRARATARRGSTSV